jgi:hypothetical protein
MYLFDVDAKDKSYLKNIQEKTMNMSPSNN